MTAGMKTALVLLSISHAAVSQPADSAVMNKRYHVNYLTIGVFSAGALTADYFAIRHFQAKPQISDAEVLALNTDGINSIDRWALHQNPANRSTYNKISDYIQPPMFILLPALLGLDKKIRKDWLDILFMYMEGHIITHTTYAYSWFGPMFQNRYRPLTYYTDLPLAERKKEGNRNSLFSGHVGSTAFTSFFIVKVYCDYHPEIGAAKYLLYTAALVPPLAMGYFRVRAMAHFPSDDLIGLTLGAAIGIIVPEVHKFQKKGITLGMFCTPDAMGLNLCWKLPVSKLGNAVAFSENKNKLSNNIR
jgi:hypothetical protein